MTRSTPSFLACFLLAACAATPGTSTVAARTDCGPLVVPSPNIDSPPPGMPATPDPGPFSYTIGPEPTDGYGAMTAAGSTLRFVPNVVLVSFDAPPEPMNGPMGKVPGILAHRDLIEPLLRDYDFEVTEQMRIPTLPQRSGAPEPATIDWSVRPDFTLTIKDPAAVSLDTLQADATAAGLKGATVFAGHGSAAVWARLLRIQRTGGCYPKLRGVYPNGLMTPM